MKVSPLLLRTLIGFHKARPWSLLRAKIQVNVANVGAKEKLKNKMPDKKPFQRLPNSIIPVNYNIRLKPNLTNFTFEGTEKIELDVSVDQYCLCYGVVLGQVLIISP